MSSAAICEKIFEENVPLDRSLLWGWMRHYYSSGGVEVWSEGDIPFHITNTPILAQDWARSILAMLRDFKRLQVLQPEHPVEVFELGAGTGRHGFMLWKELRRLEQVSRAICPEGIRFRLHLAELGSAGLESLAKHPCLAEGLENGSIMLHKFDIDEDETPIPFGQSKEELNFPSPNPVFIITNYILDSLPHDVVKFGEGKAYMGTVQLGVKDIEEGQEPTEVANLGEKITLKFQFNDEDFQYEDKNWNSILEHYKVLRTETHIPFPTSSLRLAGRSREWSQIGTAFLVADKSFTNTAQFVELEEPELVAHGGGFSFNANLHAVGLYAQKLGGYAHHTTTRDGTLDLSHVFLPNPSQEHKSWALVESEYFFEELDRFHSIDRFRTKESVDEQSENFSLRLCLDLLRLGGFDPQVLYELSDDILLGLESDDNDCYEEEEELMDVLPQSLALIFPLPDEVDVAFEIGRIAYRMEAYPLAEKAFLQSLEHYGKDARTYFNLGLTWYYREEWEKAIADFETALQQKADYEDAALWLQKAKFHLESPETEIQSDS